MIFRYIGGKEGGLDKLKGKTIGYIFFDGGYGREPIPLLESVGQGLRLRGETVSGAAGGNAEPVGHWLSVRRDRPDYMIMWGWGAMNPTAVKEAAKTSYPMDHFIGIWWSGSEDDARPAGAGGKGYLVAQLQRRGRELPGDPGHREDIVIDKGKSQTPKDQGRRELLQPRRLQFVLIAEASATRRRSPARRSSPARKCAAAWKR